MAKSRKPRKPDPNVTAFNMLERIAAKSEGRAVPEPPTKNPAAVELGRLGGLKGGKARAVGKEENSNCQKSGQGPMGEGLNRSVSVCQAERRLINVWIGPLSGEWLLPCLNLLDRNADAIRQLFFGQPVLIQALPNSSAE